MKKPVCLLMAVWMLLSLAACGAGMEDVAPGVAVQNVKSVYSLHGQAVEVTVDLSGGWTAAFNGGEVALCDKAGSRQTPVATGSVIDRLTFLEYLEEHRDSYVAANDSLKYSEGAGGSSRYLFPLGGGVYYMIDVRYGAGAEGIYDRFKVRLTEDGGDAESLDYLVLVNRRHPLPDGWEDRLGVVTVTNPLDHEVKVEAKAYAAFMQLKQALSQEGISVGLKDALRSEDEPEGSEYCTGLALDLYLRVNGKNIYREDDMQSMDYAEIWEQVHAVLADHGFILRYPKLKESATGFDYEPWHIRYIDDPALAKRIAAAGLTLEEYLGTTGIQEVEIDLGESMVFLPLRLLNVANTVKSNFADFGDCTLHRLRYAGDDCNSVANVEWLSGVAGIELYQVSEFLCDFRTGEDVVSTLTPNREYTDYPCWVGYTEDEEIRIILWNELPN